MHHPLPNHTCMYKLSCHTPFRFWQACRDLQTIPLGSVSQSANMIYQEFLCTSAASAVNLSASVRKEIKNDVDPAHRYSFASAQAQVLELMRKDVYPRYLKSAQYQEFISNEKPATFGRRCVHLYCTCVHTYVHT